jgi:hypothetical protein
MGRKKKSIGLGDTVEKITEATGIKKVVEVFSEITGIDCKCEERKSFLNNLWSYRRNVNCLKEEEYLFLKVLYDNRVNQLTPKQQYTIKDIYLNVFNEKLDNSNCSSCWRTILSDLRKVYDTYEVNE